MNTEQLDQIQARHRVAESLKVKPNGDSHTREYVRGLESVATDVPALLAYARDLEARLGRVEALAKEWDERWGRYSHAAAALGPQKFGVEFATKAIRAALTATEGAA